MPVLLVESVASLERRHWVGVAPDAVSCANPPDAVRIPHIQRLAVGYLIDAVVVAAGAVYVSEFATSLGIGRVLRIQP
jgi:hypothetical protein